MAPLPCLDASGARGEATRLIEAVLVINIYYHKVHYTHTAITTEQATTDMPNAPTPEAAQCRHQGLHRTLVKPLTFIPDRIT